MTSCWPAVKAGGRYRAAVLTLYIRSESCCEHGVHIGRIGACGGATVSGEAASTHASALCSQSALCACSPRELKRARWRHGTWTTVVRTSAYRTGEQAVWPNIPSLADIVTARVRLAVSAGSACIGSQELVLTCVAAGSSPTSHARLPSCVSLVCCPGG